MRVGSAPRTPCVNRDGWDLCQISSHPLIKGLTGQTCAHVRLLDLLGEVKTFRKSNNSYPRISQWVTGEWLAEIFYYFWVVFFFFKIYIEITYERTNEWHSLEDATGRLYLYLYWYSHLYHVYIYSCTFITNLICLMQLRVIFCRAGELHGIQGWPWNTKTCSDNCLFSVSTHTAWLFSFLGLGVLIYTH